jgi:hypothetical protein
MAQVIMPATSARPHPVDLWLCGHHLRASRQALAAAGAMVSMVSLPSAQAQAEHEPAVAPSGG